MTTAEFIYDYEESVRLPEGMRYYFISDGERQLVKAIEYKYIDIRENRLTYNLGFGTYSPENNELDDYDISENGDHYKVLNTVLSTIPLFLHNYLGAMVMVEGSDSSTSYPKVCRFNCKKRCIPPTCKNAHRRINIYKKFVNKNFDRLSLEYKFLGGTKNSENQHIIENYKYLTTMIQFSFLKNNA